MEFYKAGEFARLIGISAATLRNWDKLGWLVPHHKSPSGYRYYSSKQLNDYFDHGLDKSSEKVDLD